MSGLATSPLPYGWSLTRGQNQKGTTWEPIGYITRAVWGVNNRGAKAQRDHMGADWLHHPCRLGGQQQGSKSRNRPHVSRLATSPCGLRGPQKGDKIRKGPHVGRLATSPLRSRGSPTRVQNQKRTTCGRIGYMTLPSGGSPTRGKKQKGATCGRTGYIIPCITTAPRFPNPNSVLLKPGT